MVYVEKTGPINFLPYAFLMTMGHPKQHPIYKQTDNTKFSIIIIWNVNEYAYFKMLNLVLNLVVLFDICNLVRVLNFVPVHARKIVARCNHGTLALCSASGPSP